VEKTIINGRCFRNLIKRASGFCRVAAVEPGAALRPRAVNHSGDCPDGGSRHSVVLLIEAIRAQISGTVVILTAFGSSHCTQTFAR
jgi:hypothetical protein